MQTALLGRVWLKIRRSEGQTAGCGPCFHLPGQPILEFRFFEPPPLRRKVVLAWARPWALWPAPAPARRDSSEGKQTKRAKGSSHLGLTEKRHGHTSKCQFNHQETAGFSPRVQLPVFHVGQLFLTHSRMSFLAHVPWATIFDPQPHVMPNAPCISRRCSSHKR